MDVGRSVEKAQEQEDLLEQSEEGPSSSLTGRPVLISSAALRLKVAAALGLLGTVGLALCLFPAASRSLRGVGLSSSGTAGQAWQDSGGCPEAPLLDFYMYRSQTDENYSPVNQDMANIGGMLWYMHNEIIWHHWIRVGSFSSIPKTRIEQWRVKMRPTCALWKKGMAFGIVNTYDIGKCTGPFKCENLQHYGPTVGCETWNPGTNNHWPHEEWYGRVRYPNAAWYSLPGECASRKFWAKDQECARTEPSGACPAGKEPTGEWDCTYTYEKVGELSIDELEDISSFDDLMKKGGYEYSRATDEGKLLHFWDHINSTSANQRRAANERPTISARLSVSGDLGSRFTVFTWLFHSMTVRALWKSENVSLDHHFVAAGPDPLDHPDHRLEADGFTNIDGFGVL